MCLISAGMLTLGLVRAGRSPAQALPRATCDRSWQLQPSPTVTNSILYGVSGSSTTNVWAAGSYISTIDHFTKPLLEHWDGRSWEVVPAHGPTSAGFSGISVRTPSDAWAVGNGGTGQSVGRTLAEHWDGSRWSEVRSPNVGTGFNTLLAVTATSATDAWAVGRYTDANGQPMPMAMHWNGARWSLAKVPMVGTYAGLTAVSAASSTDVWAVGFQSIVQTLILHWDGTAWALVPSPSPGGALNVLDGVAAPSGTDAWAVGRYGSGGSGNLTLAEHWDGANWAVEPSGNIGADGNGLQAVWASSGTAWAVGWFDQRQTVARTLTESWDGSSWTVVPSPNVGTTSNGLYGVWAASPTDVYAVGTVLSASLQNQALIERYC